MTLEKNNTRLVLITGAYMLLVLLVVWFLWREIILATAVLFVLAAVELNLIGSKKLTAVFILCSIGGALVEMIAISLGAWSYETSSFLNIPLWLIPAWGNVGIFAVTLYKLLEKVSWMQKEEINPEE